MNRFQQSTLPENKQRVFTSPSSFVNTNNIQKELWQCWHSQPHSAQYVLLEIGREIAIPKSTMNEEFKLYNAVLGIYGAWTLDRIFRKGDIVFHNGRLFMATLNEPNVKQFLSHQWTLLNPSSSLQTPFPMTEFNMRVEATLILMNQQGDNDDIQALFWNNINDSSFIEQESSLKPFVYTRGNKNNCNLLSVPYTVYIVNSRFTTIYGELISLRSVLNERRMSSQQFLQFCNWLIGLHKQNLYVQVWDKLLSNLLWDVQNEQWCLMDWTLLLDLSTEEETSTASLATSSTNETEQDLISEAKEESIQMLLQVKWTLPFSVASPSPSIVAITIDTRHKEIENSNSNSISLKEAITPKRGINHMRLVRSWNWYIAELLLLLFPLSTNHSPLIIYNSQAGNHIIFEGFSKSTSSVVRSDYVQGYLSSTSRVLSLEQEIYNLRKQMITNQQHCVSIQSTIDSEDFQVFQDVPNVDIRLAISTNSLLSNGTSKWRFLNAQWTLLNPNDIKSEEPTSGIENKALYAVILPHMSTLNIDTSNSWLNNQKLNVIRIEPIICIYELTYQRLSPSEITMIIHVEHSWINFYLVIMDIQRQYYLLWSFAVSLSELFPPSNNNTNNQSTENVSVSLTTKKLAANRILESLKIFNTNLKRIWIIDSDSENSTRSASVSASNNNELILSVSKVEWMQAVLTFTSKTLGSELATRKKIWIF
jgi:hypothetical protein